MVRLMKVLAKFLLAAAGIGWAAGFVNTGFSRETDRRNTDDLAPSCHFERALCGYLHPNGETAIGPRFDWADEFSEGRARVGIKGRYGFIDRSGDFVVPAIYDAVSTYWNGFAQVRKEGKTALLDAQGAVAVPADYDVIVPLDDRRFLVGTDAQGADPGHLDFRLEVELRTANYSFLDSTTGAATQPVSARVHFLTADLGSRLWLETGRKYYLTDTDGRRLSEGFDYGGPLYRGRAIVKREGRTGAVDVDGNIVVPLRFGHIFPFADTWAVFCEGPFGKGKCGYVDRNGAVMIDARFDSASPFVDDRAKVRRGENELVINRSGVPIERETGCRGGVVGEKHDGGYRIVDTDGRPVNGETYPFAHLQCGEPPHVCKTDRQCGYLRDDGTLIAGRYFWSISKFFDGVAAVWPSEGAFAIIDRDGAFILEPMRPKAKIFGLGNGRVGYETSDGRVLIDRKIAEALARDPSPLLWQPEGPARCRDDGVAIVDKGASIVFEDKQGAPFLEGRFDFATCFKEGTAWVALPDRRQWCRITKKGTILPETCRCEQPLIMFLVPPPPTGLPCYEEGLQIVRRAFKGSRVGVFR